MIKINYKINWEAAGGAAAMPRRAAQCLKLASGIAAKVFIFFAANEFADEKAIADAVGVSPEDAADALLFWERAGVFVRVSDDEAAKNRGDSQIAVTTAVAAELLPRKKSYSPEKPSEIAAAAKKNTGISVLFKAAEKILGRTLRPTEIRLFTAISEELGLSPDILIMIIDFAQSKGRYSANYIDITARDWDSRGILTHAAAETEILRLSEFFTLEGQVKSRFGLNRSLTKPEQEQIKIWAELDFPIEIIMEAYDSAVSHTGKVQFSYITKILRGYKEKAVKTTADIKRADENYKNKTAKKAGASPSFDYTNLRDDLLDRIIEEAEEVKI